MCNGPPSGPGRAWTCVRRVGRHAKGLVRGIAPSAAPPSAASSMIFKCRTYHRADLEQQLADLGDNILKHSDTLKSLRGSLDSLERYVDSLGSAQVDPVPRTLEDLARAVGVSFDDGVEQLASRLHGSGVRSLASLLVQDEFYSQTLAERAGRPVPSARTRSPCRGARSPSSPARRIGSRRTARGGIPPGRRHDSFAHTGSVS